MVVIFLIDYLIQYDNILYYCNYLRISGYKCKQIEFIGCLHL